jgi:hypothetical protein
VTLGYVAHAAEAEGADELLRYRTMRWRHGGKVRADLTTTTTTTGACFPSSVFVFY